MCDRILAESGKECEYFTNFYDDDFIERSSIGYYQYFHSSLSSLFPTSHPNNSDHSNKPLLPSINEINDLNDDDIEEDDDAYDCSIDNNNNNNNNNIYQHPFWPSQSYINRLMPDKKDKEKEEKDNNNANNNNNNNNNNNIGYLVPTKGTISGKNSTIPRSINELISDNFMLLPSEYIPKYDNFYKINGFESNHLKLMANHDGMNVLRHRFLRCTFTAKQKINEFIRKLPNHSNLNIQYSSKWNAIVQLNQQNKTLRYENGWNSLWVQPLLNITNDPNIKFNVIKIVNKLLLTSHLYCLSYESPQIINTLKQWLSQLLTIMTQKTDQITIASTLLNLTIHTGSISNMFDVFYALLHTNNYNNAYAYVDISQISSKIESQITYWYKYACPLIPHNTISSFMHERNVDSQALYLHSIDALRNIIYSNITSDGTYLYIYHRKFGLFKIGTGYNGTIQGKVYVCNNKFTKQFLRIISPPGLLSDQKGLGNAQINSFEKYGQRYYGGNVSKTYQSHAQNPSKDIMVTSLTFFKHELLFRSREMLNNLMIKINTDTLIPSNKLINVSNNGVWVADIDRITSYNNENDEYLLGLHSPVICKHKLATRQGICSYSITGKRTVPQRWTQITLYGADKKYFICAACSNRCYREAGSESLGYKKTVLSATLPRCNEAMFCDCGSNKIPAPKNKDKYDCVCVNTKYLDKLEHFLDERLKDGHLNESEKWREELVCNSKVDALDSVHKWYFATIIDIDSTSDRIRINYDGWSSRYDEWCSKYDARIQMHKSRAVGGRESGGIIGSIDQKGGGIIGRQINQLTPVKSQFKVYIFNKDIESIGYFRCAPIGNQYKNQSSAYDFYSTGNNIIIQWISNQTCGVKIHLAVYPISNINKYINNNNNNNNNVDVMNIIQPNLYHIDYQPIIHRKNPLLPVTKAFGLTLMDAMSGGVCYDFINHCLWCYDPSFMIIDQIKCLPKPIRKLEDILEAQPSLMFEEKKQEEKEEKKQLDDEVEVEVEAEATLVTLNCGITTILEQLSRLTAYEMDHTFLIEINNANKQDLDLDGMEQKKSEQEEIQFVDSKVAPMYKKKRKYRQKTNVSNVSNVSGTISPSVSIPNDSFGAKQTTQESYNLGSGFDAISKFVKRLHCLSRSEIINSLEAAQKLILFAHNKIVECINKYPDNNKFEAGLENMIELRLYTFQIFMKFAKIIPLKQTIALSGVNKIFHMISYVADKENKILQEMANKMLQEDRIYRLLTLTQTEFIHAVIDNMRFFMTFPADECDIWDFLTVIVGSNHKLRWDIIKSLTKILANNEIFEKLTDSQFQKDILQYLINKSFATTTKFINNLLLNTDKDKESDYAVTNNGDLQILLVFHHKILWKTFDCLFNEDDKYLITFIEYIEYIFIQSRDLLNHIDALMQNKKFTLHKLQQLSKILSESPIKTLIPSIISFLSSPNMIAISWKIFNGDTQDRICNITLNELILIFDKFIDFCGIDTGNLLLLSPNARNRCNTYPMVLNSEHPWKCMQNKWYVIQDAHLNSLYLTFHPNSCTPNADGELRIGLQQHHVASIPRTALDIYLRGNYGAWPILPIEIPTDRLYLRWHKTDTPSFKPYVDLINKYFVDGYHDNIIFNGGNNNNMWGFRMESYGLLKSSRNIYKQYDPNTLHKYGFKTNSLPFLVDIQTQIISLAKSLSFHYILAHPHRNYRNNRNINRSIPIKLFSSKIFQSGWDGKTIQITDKIKIIRMKSKKKKLQKEDIDNKDKDDDNKEDIKENKEKDDDDDNDNENDNKQNEEVKVYEIDYDDPSKTIARKLYCNPITLESNKYAVWLWSSVSQNLMIPKSFKQMIEDLRLPVLSSLIRHLPLKQQCLFVEEKINKSDDDMEIIKNVFMIGNNILRWVLDNLMNEKKAFQQIEQIYNLCVKDMEFQQQITDITNKKVQLLTQIENEQKDQQEKEQKEEQSQQNEQKESPEPQPNKDLENKEDENEKKEKEDELTPDPELEKLEDELKNAFLEADKNQWDLKNKIKKACKTIQPFLHKYFSIYCEGNGVRFGFSRSSLISYDKFELQDISQHLNMWITKCLQSLLDHTPDLNICLNNFIRSFMNRIEIILQMSFNTDLSLKAIQHFLCCDYYFSYCDNPIFEINSIILQRQNECSHRVKAIEYLLQLIDCSLKCNSTYQLAFTVNIPPSPLKRWCYTHGLQGVQFIYIQELKQIFAEWLSKMLSIGDTLHQFTKEKVTTQHTYRQKLIKIKSPKKSSKSKEKKEEKKEEDDNDEEEKKILIIKKKKIIRSPKALNQEIINRSHHSHEQFLDIYQIVLETISSAQFDKNDMNLLFETNALPILFKWEALMCKCQCPIQQLHKSDFMWNAILRVLHSCCEGIFQWIESDNKYENDKIAAQLSTNILSQILERLHTELQFIASIRINDEIINQQITTLQNIHKKKLKLSEIKRWKNKRIRTSHECILKYFELLHRLSSFNTASNQLGVGNNRIYYSYLNLLFIILCNHHYLQHYHHRIYSLCVQKLCNLLPTLNFESFNDIIKENGNENKLLSFNSGETFLEFIIKSIGCYLYLEPPSIPNWTSLQRTSSIQSESEKISGYGSNDNKHGTYSLILKIPGEINANSFIKYLVPKYLNQEFIAMINKFTQVPSNENKSDSPIEDKHRLSDVDVDVFVHQEEESNDNVEYEENEQENDDESNYHIVEEEDNEDEDHDYDEDEDEVDEDDEEEDEYEEEEQEEEDEAEHEHESRAFDAILAFEEFMSSAVAASKIKAGIVGIKSMFDAQQSTEDDHDETKIWLKKVNDSLNDEKSAILYTGKLKHCYSLAGVLANNGAIVYIEKSRNIADRNENLIAINQNDDDNNIIPLQNELMWNYYFMNGIIKSLIASPTWFDAINKCFNKISIDFFDLFEEIDIEKERNNNSISWMNNDWCNNLVTDLKKNMDNDNKLKLLFGVLVCLNNNYYGKNSNVYKYLNRSNNHHHLFVGCRVRVTHLNKLQFEGLITFINTKSREITILLDNFYVKQPNNTQSTTSSKLKPFEIIRLGEHHEIEIIDFISDTKCITNHTKTVSIISLNIIQTWSNLLQKLQVVLKTWTKMNAMLSAKHQQSIQATLKEEENEDKQDLEDMPKTPTQRRRRTTQSSSDISGLSPLQQPQKPEKTSEKESVSNTNPQSPKAAVPPQSEPFVMDDSAVAMLAMAFGDEDGFDLAELQKAMALSMSVEPEQPQQSQSQENVDNIDYKQDIDIKPENDTENKQDAKEEDKEKEKDAPKTPTTPISPMNPKMQILLIDDKDDDKDDEKQLFPSQSFIATSRKLQAKRTQYQILFNLIQSQMLNIIHNTLLIADADTLLNNKNMLLSFADTFISMANTQASSSSNWQSQYENCLTMYHDLLAHNYLFNEFNRHIITIIENDSSKEENMEENDKKQTQKRLTSEQMATVPYQTRYDCEDKKIIGMDGDLLDFPTRWNLRFLKHFIIHPQALQIEYKENKGKSLMVTTNNKVPFIYDYYFEIKIIKIDQLQQERKENPQNDKSGNLSIGLRSNWADFFVSNTGWKWISKRRFLQFDTDSTSNVLNTNPPKIEFFQSFIQDKLFATNNNKEDKDDKKDKKDKKADIISSMHETFESGDYVDIYDESEFIPVWKSAKIMDIKSDENKTIVVKILSEDMTKEFALANPKNKNIYKKIAPFGSKCKNESVSIKDRDFNEATDFGLMRFGVGDYIGCGINQVDGEIYFTQNGKRFWGNKATFNNVPLFDYYPTIEIRQANIMIEANFGQKEFQYCEKNNVNKDTDEERRTKWKIRVSEYEEQLNAATKQILSAKRNKEELRSMAYARRLDIGESISAGGLLVGINQRQLLRGIEFNQDDPNRVVDWALNQENYESAFAELGPSKSEREIEAEQQETNKKKERLCKLQSLKEMVRNNEEKEANITTPIRAASNEITPTLLSPISPIFNQAINKPIPGPDYANIIDNNMMDVQFEKTKPFENYDQIYDGIELEYGFNTLDNPTGTWTNILPIYYTQIVTDPMVEKWLNRVESRLTIHGMDRFTMIEILTRLRVNPHDMVALMQAREIDPGLDKCPIQRLSSTSSTGSHSPMSPSKHIRRSVKQVNVTPQLLKYLKFGVRVHVKADIQSRISMIRAKIWVDQLENIRNSVGKIIYVDTDTKPKLALVLFENENEGKQERWWLPLNVLQLAILDYNSSIILPPNKLAKLYLHNINKTCSSIAKICLQLLYNISQHVQQQQQQPAFNSIQNYQYYASLLYNPITMHMTNKSIKMANKYEYVANVLSRVNKQQQTEALNDIIHSILQQLNHNSFKINLNPNNNALLIRQYAFRYKVSIGCDILLEIIKDSSLKTKNDDALTVYGDMKCTNILYRFKLHELKTIIFEQSEIWISLTGETELSLSLSPIPRLINLFICPSIRNKWNWDLILINTLMEGYFASDNIPTVIASQWMLSIANILHDLLINNKQENIQKELELKENEKIKQAIQSWTKKLQIRLRFYYSSDIEQLQQANNNINTLSYCCLHSKLFKHIFATRLLAERLFNINDCDATDHWYINAIDTIKNAQYFQQHNKFSAEFISNLCSDYLLDSREEEKMSDDPAIAKINVNNDEMEMKEDDKDGVKDGDKPTEETKPDKMNEEKEEIIKEKQKENVEKKAELHPNKNDKLHWLESWSKKEDILLLNIMTRYNMESKFIELYSSVGNRLMKENSEYRLMIEKILNCIEIKQLKQNKKVFLNISEFDWKLIIFYRCILLCEFNKNMASFLSLIDIDFCSPFYDLIECILPIIFLNLRQNYFNRILDYTATLSAFRQPFDLQIDRILSTDSFSFYDCVLFQAHQVLLHTDSARLRTPWSLGRGLRTETPFIIKLHDEPVEGDEGPFRAFFARLVDELQHNLYHPQHDQEDKEDEKEDADEEDQEINRVDDINYCLKNENGTPITLALLVPTPNRSNDLGENREYFMFNPNLLYYLQAQSYYCLGRIIGISIRCSVPLHFDFPIWIWILIKNMSKYKCIRGQVNKHSNDIDIDIDIDQHMNYLKQFDITTFQSLENIRKLNDKSLFKQLIEMLNVSEMMNTNTNINNKQEYEYTNRLNLIKDILIYQLYTRFEGQIYALICGLSEIIPLNALNLFNEIELRLKICGSSQINLSLLKDHTVYRDGLSLNHQLIKNFWEVVLSLDEELKPKFIDFVYAQKRLPSKQEFIRKNLRLQISVLKVDNPDQTLPQSQTCFLNLQIPQYTTKDSLKRNFTKALTTASGFYKESSE